MKVPILLLFLALTSTVAAPLAAQETPPQPTTITATKTDIRSAANETVFIFTGLVRIEATALVLTCDRLEVVALRSAKKLKELKGSDLGDSDKFKSLLATGNVRIVQPGRTATCGRAEILPQENRITLEQNPFVQLEDTSTVTGDKLILYRGQEGIERIEGDGVKMSGPPIKDLSAKAKTPKPSGTETSTPAAPATTPPANAPAHSPGAPQITLPGTTPEKKP